MEKITTTDLMQPRRKLIAPYPHCQYEVGTVLHIAEDGELFSPEYGFSGSQWKITIEDADKCHQNFKKLEWWEERKVEDMPEYVKAPTGRIGMARFDLNDSSAWFMYLDEEGIPYSPTHWLPSTIQEYNEYQKQNHGTD